MLTKDSIINDLKKLGLKNGDTVFLRISYKSIGKIEGGPKAFLDAVGEVIGRDGTMLLTAFPSRFKNKLKAFHKSKALLKGNYAEPITGVMSKIAMKYPSASISSRMDFPFVAIGKHADYLTSNHTYDKSGYWVLEEAISKFNCICLRIGGDPYLGTTHMSLSHVMREKGEFQMAPRYGIWVKDNGQNKWVENNNVVFCLNALKNYLPDIINKVRINEGFVGGGYAIITNMKKSMLEEEQLFRQDIKHILCTNPNCCVCRTSFSFSEETVFHYLIRQIKKSLIEKDLKGGYKKIRKEMIMYILFRTRND